MQLNDTVRELLNAAQTERRMSMSWRNQGDAFADERGHDGQDELVDRARIQERRDDLAAAASMDRSNAGRP